MSAVYGSCIAAHCSAVDEMMSAVHGSCIAAHCSAVDEFLSLCAALPCFAGPIAVPLMSLWARFIVLAFPFPAIPLMRWWARFMVHSCMYPGRCFTCFVRYPFGFLPIIENIILVLQWNK